MRFATGLVGKGALLNVEESLSHFKRRQLLAETGLSVVGRVPPGWAVGTVIAADLGRRNSRLCEVLGNLVLGEGGKNSSLGHPSGEVGLEGVLVNVALAAGLAHLEHDVFLVAGVLEKGASTLQETLGAVLPGVVALGDVEHESRSVQEHGVVVGPLRLVGDGSAVVLDTNTIIDLEVVADESHFLGPVVDLHGPVCILLLSGVAGETGSQSKGSSVTDGVLVIVAIVVLGVDLPPQSSTAVLGIPAADNVLERVLGDLQVGGWCIVRVGKVVLHCRHDGEGPECLVIVALHLPVSLSSS